MGQKLVNFRGNSDGIIITVKKGGIDDIISEVEKKIDESREFFKGAKVREISGSGIEDIVKEKIEALVVEKYGMTLIDREALEKEQQLRREASERTRKMKIAKAEENMFKTEGVQEGTTKFMESTVRSGQLVEYDGNIVVLGDVNPGGVLSASGNIVVLGALKGIARAGNRGDRKAMVAAFSLEPTQLQIADVMSRKPDEDVEVPEWPEIAKIQDNMIVIESYLKRNSRK